MRLSEFQTEDVGRTSEVIRRLKINTLRLDLGGYTLDDVLGRLDEILAENEAHASEEYEAQKAAQKAYDAKAAVAAASCPQCAQNVADGLSVMLHDGSPNCESGSLASGGRNVHCTCDVCF